LSEREEVEERRRGGGLRGKTNDVEKENPENLNKYEKIKKDSLPEVHVRVVEDVGVRVEVVEALRAQHHADVVAAIEEWDHLEEELLGRDLLKSFFLSFFSRGVGDRRSRRPRMIFFFFL